MDAGGIPDFSAPPFTETFPGPSLTLHMDPSGCGVSPPGASVTGPVPSDVESEGATPVPTGIYSLEAGRGSDMLGMFVDMFGYIQRCVNMFANIFGYVWICLLICLDMLDMFVNVVELFAPK